MITELYPYVPRLVRGIQKMVQWAGAFEDMGTSDPMKEAGSRGQAAGGRGVSRYILWVIALAKKDRQKDRQKDRLIL